MLLLLPGGWQCEGKKVEYFTDRMFSLIFNANFVESIGNYVLEILWIVLGTTLEGYMFIFNFSVLESWY